ncbi:hypothetical protein F5Y16DRAFT_227592 [Xylariaceae sp. FL0255]|nr:hypothetical protein F5Y16DRAFT_227592 [Xylariaceae sp. FL0255]
MRDCSHPPFNTPKDMLQHLKDCRLFPRGEFWCPSCQADDSFRTASTKICSWNRVNTVRKFIRGTKKVFRGIVGAQSGDGDGLCAKCRPPVSTYMPSPDNKSQVPQEFSPTSSSPGTLQSGDVYTTAGLPAELPAQFYVAKNVSELFGERISLSDERCFQQLTYDQTFEWPKGHQRRPSELSSDSVTRLGISTNVSPASNTPSSESHSINIPYPPTAACRSQPRHQTIRSEVIEGFDSTHNVLDQRHASLPTNMVLQSSHVSDFITPFSVEQPALPPQIVKRQPSGATPSLTLDTTNISLESTPTNAQLAFLLNDGQTLDESTDMTNLGMVVISPRFDHLDQPYSPSDYDVFHAGSSPSYKYENPQLNSSPSELIPFTSSSEISPSSISSDCDLQCSECGFRPTGKLQNRPAYLRKHKGTHRRSKEFCCDQCNTKFTRPDNLTTHRRKIHNILNRVPKRQRSSESLMSSGRSKRKGSLVDDGIDFL